MLCIFKLRLIINKHKQSNKPDKISKEYKIDERDIKEYISTINVLDRILVTMVFQKPKLFKNPQK